MTISRPSWRREGECHVCTCVCICTCMPHARAPYQGRAGGEKVSDACIHTQASGQGGQRGGDRRRQPRIPQDDRQRKCQARRQPSLLIVPPYWITLDPGPWHGPCRITLDPGPWTLDPLALLGASLCFLGLSGPLTLDPGSCARAVESRGKSIARAWQARV